MRLQVPMLVAAGVLVGAGLTNAHAHGQFPLPITVLPGGPPLGVATFGVLVPAGDRAGYQWVCEEMAGGNLTTAVAWTRTAQGTLVAGGRGVVRFTANTCGATRPQGAAATLGIRSAASHPDLPVVGLGAGVGEVHVSEDDGQSFALALQQDGGIARRLQVEGTAGDVRLLVQWNMLSDGHIEWVQARVDGTELGRTVVTDPGGRTWELVARDGAHADHVYARENGDTQDRLLRVSLGTGAVAAVLREATDELVLAASRDGTHVATGGLVSPLMVSTDSGDTWVTRTAPGQVRGLAWGPNGELYVAADNWRDGFAFAGSTDLGVSWEGYGRFVDIQGVRTCADAGPGCEPGADACVAGTGNDVEAQCAHYWPYLRDLFGIGLDAGGGVGMDGGASVADAGGPVPALPGCPGCQSAGPAPLLALLAVLVARVRVRRVHRSA